MSKPFFQFSTLLGTDNNAAIIGLPRKFDLRKQLRNARMISIATAFARTSGWDKLQREICSNSTAEVRLLTGISYCLTEPDVLKSWFSHSKKKLSRLKAKLFNSSGLTFHPKVMIVKSDRYFAIVGSGNLTEGGLLNNIECSLYIEHPEHVVQIEKWFNEVFASNASKPIDDKEISSYEPKFHNAKKWRAKLEKKEVETAASIERLRKSRIRKLSQRISQLQLPKKASIERLWQAYKSEHTDHEDWLEDFTQVGNYVKMIRKRITHQKGPLRENDVKDNDFDIQGLKEFFDKLWFDKSNGVANYGRAGFKRHYRSVLVHHYKGVSFAQLNADIMRSPSQKIYDFTNEWFTAWKKRHKTKFPYTAINRFFVVNLPGILPNMPSPTKLTELLKRLKFIPPDSYRKKTWFDMGKLLVRTLGAVDGENAYLVSIFFWHLRES